MRGLEGSSVDPSSHGGYFREIEALSKALNVESKPLRSRSRAVPPSGSRNDRESQLRDEKGGHAAVGCAPSRSLSTGKSFAPPDSDRKEKKPSSLWNWKPLKALSHIRHRRFDCIFSMCVHSIDNIPPALADSSLCVHWRRAAVDSGSTRTRPAVVHRAAAKFDESLTYNCSVYGSRSRAQGSAKYEAKHFLIYVTVVGSPGLDLGKHKVDLTRLLPLNLQELEEGKSSGNWSTSFRLSGKAIGACLSVSFGFSVVVGDEKVQKPGGDTKIFEVSGEKGDRANRVTRLGSLPAKNSQFVDDVKALGEIMENKLDVVPDSIASRVEAGVIDKQDNSAEMKCCVLPEPCDLNMLKRTEDELMVIECEMEITKEDNINMTAKRLDSERAVMQDFSEIEVIKGEANQKEDENSYCHQMTGELATLLEESTLKNDESTFFGISFDELEEMGYPELKAETSENLSFDDVELKQKAASMKSPSCSLDDLTEEVASEFLSMLDVEHGSTDLSSEGDPESPREQLWKQFRRESLGHGCGMFGFDVEVDEEINWVNSSEGFDFSSTVYDADSENKKPSQSMESKSMARVLEDAETEALLREWGLNEKVFDSSPPGSRNGFGSPIDLPPEEPPELPPLGENLGCFVQTKDGGFLRSMSPNLFKDSKSNGSLIMQVSKPVVLPAEMGSDNMEVLQHLASIGVEKLSMQASKLMPLEEITGNFMQQLAWHSVPDTETFQRQGSHQNHEDDSLFNRNGPGATDRGGESNCDYVSLEDLAPLAMDKIEALSMEGLKIQSGMSDEEVPTNITKQVVGEISNFDRKEVRNLTSLGLEGAVGLHLLDVKDNEDDVDGLMGLSISLDEWMQLDMGIVEEEYELSDRTSKILAAHHAKPTEFSSRGRKDDKKGKISGRRWGLLENNFTVALMVQLRDPFRNYEPVGTPMLALIQVERVFIPPKPKIYCTVSGTTKSEQENESDTEKEPVLKLEKENVVDVIPQFKVAEVHVAGLKAEPEKKKHWGNSIQQHSGSRWLLANGMGKHSKHPLMKSNASNKTSQLTTKTQPDETLWSISSRIHGNGSKWNEDPPFFCFVPHMASSDPLSVQY
ncbi:hypothetical protein MA16_Dca003974 [Dendrobium catenatum]|uniref:C2 NT-type domain-containing protein n=1 Tax=Dendrobium catenatum TaxID=906689 RepID=A0A2I0X236_9ASPA|nr:hypothetical protein MA16_Dca003974 [Dendrobium catenatum]